VGPVGGRLGELVSDKALAYAWLYGDLVHADDDVTERVGQHDINARFEGGVLLIANVAVLAISTLNLLRYADENGLIELGDDLFTQSVLARGSYELPISAVATAPVGTLVELIDAALDAALSAEGDG
jgi:hypothetical protein